MTDALARMPGERRSVFGALLVAWLGVGVWAYVWFGHSYARAMTRYDPGGACGFGDRSGCRPHDQRPGWLLFCALVSVVLAIRMASTKEPAAGNE